MVRSLLVLLVIVGGAACSREEQASAQPVTTSTAAAQPAQAAPARGPRELIARGATVIDVRTPDEYAAGRLPTATNIPLDELPQRLGEIDQLVGGDKSKPIVVYCRTGNRSSKAKGTLEGAGFTQVINGGGLNDLR